MEREKLKTHIPFVTVLLDQTEQHPPIFGTGSRFMPAWKVCDVKAADIRKIGGDDLFKVTSHHTKMK